MVKELLYRPCSFEMTLRQGDDKGKGNSRRVKVEDMPSSPRSMLVLLKRHHLGKTGDHRAHLEI